jgi:transposase
MADEEMIDKEIAFILCIGNSTVFRTRKKYCEEGLDGALYEKHRPGQPSKLTDKQEAVLIAVACSSPPQGYSKWSLRLLQNKIIELGFVEYISHVTIGEVLKKAK